MRHFTSLIAGMVMGVGSAISTPAAAEDHLECSVFSKEGYAEYSARIEEGISLIEQVKKVISNQKSPTIRQYIVANIDESMKEHVGRSDQEYWMKNEIRSLCRRETQRIFEELLLDLGAASPGEVGRAIWKTAFPNSNPQNDLQPLAVLWRIQNGLGCTGTYADALSMRSREFQNVYHSGFNCPIRF